MVAAPVAATPGAGAAPAAGGAAAPAEVKNEEKKEKKTANVKLVKYDAKDKIKVGTERWVHCRLSRRCAVCLVSV